MMKTIPLTFLFTLLYFSTITAQDYSIVGTWQATMDNETGKFIFDKKGYATIDQGGEKIGGKKYKAKGLALKVVYELNPTADPKTLDFIIKKIEDDLEITRMVAIYKFVNEKILILNLNFSSTERPERFDPDSPNQIVLHKMK
ncbi:MAG: hypothetical protein ABIQ02_13440 [Saprospiraceae bacterium]